MIFYVILALCTVVFFAGIARIVSRHIPRRMTDHEAKQLPFMVNPEIMDYIRKKGGIR